MADDQMTAARAEGYDWNDISSHLATASANAANEGYAQTEIDAHLGYDTAGAHGSAKQAASGVLAENPDLLQQIGSGDPRFDLSVDADLRGQYALGLLQGTAKGPDDFAGGYAAAMLDSAHGVHGLDDSSADLVRARGAAVQNSADYLAQQLPTNTDLIDGALHLGMGDLDLVPNIKKNLLDHWLDTGLHPIGATLAAETDPALREKLTAPNPNAAFPNGVAPTLSELQQPHRDAIEKFYFVPGEELVDAKSVSEALKDFGIDVATVAGFAVAGKYVVAPLARLAIDKLGYLPEYLDTWLSKAERFTSVDPAKEPGAALSEVSARDAVLPPRPAKMIEPEAPAEGGEPGVATVDPTASPAGKIARLMALEQRNLADDAAFGTDRFFQDLHAKAVDNGIIPLDQETAALAEGMDKSVGLTGFLRGLMGDASGAVALPQIRTPVAIATAVAAGRARDFGRPLIVKAESLAKQEIAHWSDFLEPHWPAVSKHMPEWEAELAKGPGGSPMNTVMGQAIQYIEGRSSGVTISPDHPLRPLADAIRTVEQAMDQKLRQQAQDGVITYEGYIEDHFRHQWSAPSQASTAFVGTGKVGERGGLRERTTFPTYADGIAAGLEPKFANPIEAEIHDLTGKIQYSHAADMLDMAKDAGHLYWGFSPRNDVDTAIEHAIGRHAVPLTDPATGEATARIQNLYGNPGFISDINNWLGRGLNARPGTASAYENLLYAKNTTTGLKLLWPAFHAIVEGVGSIASGIGQALDEVDRKQFISAFANFVKAGAIAPNIVENLYVGAKARTAYVKMAGDPIVQALTEAGLSMVKPRAASGELMSNAPPLWTSFARGTLTRELGQDVRSIFGDAQTETNFNRAYRVPDRVLQFGIKEAGRLAQSLTGTNFFFDTAIPALKAGASYRRVQSFIAANPTASPEALQKFASQVVRDVDNRMGELNFDTVFWPRAAKQIAQVAMISPSWAYGTYRGVAAAVGVNIDRMALEWNPVATRSLIGTAVAFGYANSILQFIHTHTLPTSLADVMNYRTGGTSKDGTPERGMVPSELKEFFDLGKIMMYATGQPSAAFQGMKEYAFAKANPFIQGLIAAFTGEDAIGHKIANTPGGWPKFLRDNYMPILAQQLEQRRRGTEISKAESIVGFKEAARFVESPTAYLKSIAGIREKWTKEELRRAQRENAALENPDPSIGQAPSTRGQSGARAERVGNAAAARTDSGVASVYGGQSAAPVYGGQGDATPRYAGQPASAAVYGGQQQQQQTGRGGRTARAPRSRGNPRRRF